MCYFKALGRFSNQLLIHFWLMNAINLLFMNSYLIYSHIQNMEEDQLKQYKQPKTVKLFYQSVQSAYNNRDQRKLAEIFKELYFKDSYSSLKADKWNYSPHLNSYSHNNFGSAFAKILELIKEFQIERASDKWLNAFDNHMKLIIGIIKCLEEIREHMWMAKALRVLIRATKKIFFNASKGAQTTGMGAKLKNDLLNTLQRYKAARALDDDVKKQFLPIIDIMQISILLSFHNYEQIQRIIYSPKIYGEFGPKFIDNFHFQRGKYALINENVIEAEECFEKIKIKTKGQKRLVLKYLIPCKIFLGKMFAAKANALDEEFPEYQLLIKAIVNADFAEYDRVNLKYQKVWLKRGIYLLMDRLRIIVWRNLVKRMNQVVGEKIDIEQIQKIVNLKGGQEKLNQCICIIANLIYEGYIKGYIYQNQQKRTLVLKKQKAFPSLASIAK